MTNTAPYTTAYTSEGFWDKIGSYASSIGKGVLRPALLLYFTLQMKDIPAWAKATILGALGYFISPIDAIPDFTPVVGYSDDLAVLTAAIAVVSVHIDDEVRQAADQKLAEWFG